MLQQQLVGTHFYMCTISIRHLFHRWWDLKMSSLDLNAPLTVQSTVTIQETLNLLTKEGFDQVPVVDEEG